MKFITVRDLRSSPAQIWKELLEEKEMIITKNGRPIALLTPISDENSKETLRAMRRSRAANAIRNIQIRSVKTGRSRLTDKEIDNEIRQSRQERSR
jgi:prevent-host-death family protein